MIIEASKRLRKFFNKELTDDMIWDEIIRDGRLHNIHQLTRLSGSAAHALIKLEKRMNLLSLGIVEMSPEVAGALARYNGVKLMLNCVRELSNDTAKALSVFKGGKLSLNGITALSLPLLGRLSSYRGDISLKGVEDFEIDPKDARRSETVFKSLEAKRLILDGVQEPSLSFLSALSRYRGHLDLNGIRTLSGEQAEILSRHVGTGISLRRVAVLDSAFHVFFTRCQGYLDLSGAISIADKTLSVAASRVNGSIRYSTPVKQAIKKWKEEEEKQAREIKDQLVLDFSTPPVPDSPVPAKTTPETAKTTPAAEPVILDIPEQPDLPEPDEPDEPNLDDQLLDEFEKFDEMELTEVSPHQHQWEIDDSDDPYEIDETVLDNIESGLNKEIERKKKRVQELLSKGFSNLLQSEKDQVTELKEQIENLKDNIRGALNVLVEQKELGSVVFTNSEDLVSYLKDVGEDDENDALSRLDDDDFDMFGSNFGSGDEEDMVVEEVSGMPADLFAQQGNGQGLEQLKDLPGAPPEEDDTVEGDGFVLSFQ